MEQEAEAREEELNRREQALAQREPKPAPTARDVEGTRSERRSGRTAASAEQRQSQLIVQQKRLAGKEKDLRVREQALATRESQQREYGKVIGNIAETFERLQGQLTGHGELLRRRCETRLDRGVQPAPTPGAGQEPPTLRSAVDILRRLGATGSDEELEAKLAQNPCLESTPEADPPTRAQQPAMEGEGPG
jgi:hypothetical protein